MVMFARPLCKTDGNLTHARGRTLMSLDQAAKKPSSVSETSLTFVAKAYFSLGELEEARRLYKESGSYAQSITYLVGCGQDLRRTLSYLTIPGGKVHIPR